MYMSEIHEQDELYKLAQDYDLGDATVIGKGGNGSVSIIKRKSNGEAFALKTIKNKHMADKAMLDELLHEIEVQKALDHPNIVKVYEAFEDIKNCKMYIVMELCTGGDLCSRLRQPNNRHGTGEKGVATMVEEMLSAVHYCHQRGVIHRDIKLDNFMFEDKQEEAELKMIDFGFAVEVAPGHEKMWEKLGTPSYMAPELWSCQTKDGEACYNTGKLRKAYDSAVDMWAVGVTVYMLLGGQRPFFHADIDERARMICNEPLTFHGDWGGVSDEAKDFVTKLLEKDASARLNAHDAMEHPWIKHRSKLHAIDSAEDLKRHDDVLKSLQDFSHAGELQKVALEVIAYSTPPSKMKELRDMFVHMDTDNAGTINKEKFRHAMSLHPEIPIKQVDMMFASMDQTHTGEVDYTEFLAAAISSQQSMDAPSLTTVFGLLDKDCDGYITADDLIEALGIDEESEIQMEEIEHILALGAGIKHHEDGKGGHRVHHGSETSVKDGKPQLMLNISDFKYLLMAHEERKSNSRVESADHKSNEHTHHFKKVDKLMTSMHSHFEHIGHHSAAKGKAPPRGASTSKTAA